MKLVPLGEKVIIKPSDPEQTTSGGIVLPDAAQEKPHEGRVLSVGDGKLLKDGTRQAHEIGEGDRVLYSQYSGTEIKVAGETLLIMDETEIMAVVS